MNDEIYPFNKDLENEEQRDSLEEDTNDLPPTDIVAYNELRSCADIVRMEKAGQLTVNPDFQRDVVWKKPDQTRLIDSLIKQLPIPSMCISFDFNTNERLVIDGLQRISTIINFLTKAEYTLSELDDVDSRISGKSVSFIKTKHKQLYDRVENLTIPITVIRCDYSKKTHMDYLFTIFHRLNSGGTKLNNQEIRNCIYNGPFNTFLKSTTKYRNYIALFNIKRDLTYRFAFEELNLRFFAFSERLETYNGRLAKYLNEYMFDKEKNPKIKPISDAEISEKRTFFEDTIDLTYRKIYNSQSAENVSKSVIEAVLVGVGKNLDYLNAITAEEAQALLEKLKSDDLFSVENLKEGLAQKARVTARMNKSIEIFGGR